MRPTIKTETMASITSVYTNAQDPAQGPRVPDAAPPQTPGDYSHPQEGRVNRASGGLRGTRYMCVPYIPP